MGKDPKGGCLEAVTACCEVGCSNLFKLGKAEARGAVVPLASVEKEEGGAHFLR